MKRRKLGNSGLEVAPVAFGGNVFGWTVDEQTSFKLLDAFVAYVPWRLRMPTEIGRCDGLVSRM